MQLGYLSREDHPPNNCSLRYPSRSCQAVHGPVRFQLHWNWNLPVWIMQCNPCSEWLSFILFLLIGDRYGSARLSKAKLFLFTRKAQWNDRVDMKSHNGTTPTPWEDSGHINQSTQLLLEKMLWHEFIPFLYCRWGCATPAVNQTRSL